MTRSTRIRTDDGHELSLSYQLGIYTLRFNGRELMSSRAHSSEAELARLTLAGVATEKPRVLIGGLGMGYTLRAVLDAEPQNKSVVVAEIFGIVIEWNWTKLKHLTNAAVADPRVTAIERDVSAVIEECPNTFDAIVLDVDNGPGAITLPSNRRLYEPEGLAAIYRSLRPGGKLGVWSSEEDREFASALRSAGFQVEIKHSEATPSHRSTQHIIFVATAASL